MKNSVDNFKNRLFHISPTFYKHHFPQDKYMIFNNKINLSTEILRLYYYYIWVLF